MKYIITIISILTFFSCSNYTSEESVSERATIYPDYDSTVIPRAIAPLNFTVKHGADSYIFELFDKHNNESLLKIESKDGNCIIPIKKWKQITSNSSLKEIDIKIGVIENSIKYNYKPIVITISDDEIDNYIAYRSIEPGYESWGQMGLYQRDLSTFDEYTITETTSKDRERCVNCHSFCNNSSDIFMFHARKINAGTYISIDGEVKRINTKTGSMMGDAAYPSWHPSGKYIAFSTNITRQGFHNSGNKPVEVFDQDSDIVIYDCENNTMFSSKLLYDNSKAESFPWWSRDGKYLYFISTPKLDDKEFDPVKIKYNLYRVAFDKATKEFSDYELIFDAESLGKSITMPRTYHDDKKVSFAMCEYGSFSIWHENSDIYSVDLKSKELTRLDALNSDRCESYRSFSKNGNWVIFSSRRDDGLFTRLYISHYNKETESFSKPFMLPQQEPILNIYNEKSYNIPEFVDNKIDTQNQIIEALQQNPIQAKSQLTDGN